MQRRAHVVLFLMIVAAGGLCMGCRGFKWRNSGPDNAPDDEPTRPLSLKHAQDILHGRARGILLAGNGGLTGQGTLSNSLAAVQAAIDHGLPMVVVDVCQTADKVCVLDQDQALTRPRGRRRRWRELDHEQLRAQTSQSAAGPIPSLSEALDLARGRILVGLRLRTADVSTVVGVIDRMDLADQVLVFATTPAQVRAASPYLHRRPPIMVGFDASAPERLAQIESTPPWPTVVQLGRQTLSPANIARVRTIGARVMVHQRGVLLVRVGTGLMPYHRMGVTVILTDWARQLLREMREINTQPATAEG